MSRSQQVIRVDVDGHADTLGGLARPDDGGNKTGEVRVRRGLEKDVPAVVALAFGEYAGTGAEDLDDRLCHLRVFWTTTAVAL